MILVDLAIAVEMDGSGFDHQIEPSRETTGTEDIVSRSRQN
mgnify:CR=1 FL=1